MADHHVEGDAGDEGDPGYDDEYGYKSEKRVQSGHPDFYAHEKIYHDEDYHRDRASQEATLKTGEGRWHLNSSKVVKKTVPFMYPGRDEPLKTRTQYLRARSAQYTSDQEAKRGGPERVAVSGGNRDAARARYKETVATTDFAYPKEHRLRNHYWQAVNGNRVEDYLNEDAQRRRREADEAQQAGEP